MIIDKRIFSIFQSETNFNLLISLLQIINNYKFNHYHTEKMKKKPSKTMNESMLTLLLNLFSVSFSIKMHYINLNRFSVGTFYSCYCPHSYMKFKRSPKTFWNIIFDERIVIYFNIFLKIICNYY